MATYKVPQDVEADDKLIGPFSFRQFIYLLVAGGLAAVAVGLFQIFPALVIIPLPPILLMLALALPLRKDQPMETYLAAIVTYYIKPRRRVWTAGQKETTIQITAPKIVEESRVRDLTQEEATHRLSFLADVVDSGGHSIQQINSNVMRDDLVAEANQATDMFDEMNSQSQAINRAIDRDREEKHSQVINSMRAAIERSENYMTVPAASAPVSATTQGYVIPSTATAGAYSNVAATNGTAGGAAGTNSTHGEKVVEPAVEDLKKSSVVVQPETAEEEKARKEQEAREREAAIKAEENRKLEEENKQKNASTNVMNGKFGAGETKTDEAGTTAGADETTNSAKNQTQEAKPDIIELANNPDYSVATIAKEAKRIKRKEDGEVFISLH